MPIFSHRPIYVCKYSNNRTLKINWAVRNITLIKSAGFYLSSGGFRSRKSFSAAQSKTNPTDNRANRKGNLACTRDTARLPWRTKRTDTIPRPASSQFSNKQQVVVNGITCWLVNNEKQLPRLSLSLSPSLFLLLSFCLVVGQEEILHKFKRWLREALSGGARTSGRQRCFPKPANKTKNSGTILSVHKTIERTYIRCITISDTVNLCGIVISHFSRNAIAKNEIVNRLKRIVDN